jgi:hypothetical protein
MRGQAIAMVSLGLLMVVISPIASAQKIDEVAFEPPLANGAAPDCPEHIGSRTLRSETVGKGEVSAVILGATERNQKKECISDANLVITGTTKKTIRLPDPGKQEFSIVDFSEDGSQLLLATEHDFEFPNEQFRNSEIAVFDLTADQLSWVNVWDLFGWQGCGATVEPQGFTATGRVVLRVRPSVMMGTRRPDCVSTAGLYETDLTAKPDRLPNDSKITRHGELIREAEAPCKTDPDIVAACFSVHGRLSAWNGTPTMRIWRVGTKRILGVQDGPMPSILDEKMNWDIEAWGNFEVCPFTHERAGVMQNVCVEKVDRPIFRDRK